MNPFNLKKLTKPAAPVTLAQVKEFLRIDNNAEDTTLMTYAKAASNRLEAACDTVFVETQFLFTLDNFPFKKSDEWWDGVREGSVNQFRQPNNSIEIPVGNITEVTEFKVTDSADQTVDFLPSNWTLDNVRSQGRITLKFGAIWPVYVLAANNAIKIKFKAGLVSDPTQLPEEIQLAVLQMVSSIYEHRGDEFPEIPGTAMLLLEPYRRFKV